MSSQIRSNYRFVLPIMIPVLIGLLTPSVVVLGLNVFVKGTTLIAAITDTEKGPFAKDMCCWHPFLLWLTLIPFIALSLLIWFASNRFTLARLIPIELLSLLGILAVTVAGHISVWYPLYGGGHISSTAVVAFIFIPFYAMGGMLAGAFLGWLISLLPPLRTP